jgi:hypothetical protein
VNTQVRLYRFKADMVLMAESPQEAMLMVADTLIEATSKDEGDEGQAEGLVEGSMEMRLLERNS